MLTPDEVVDVARDLWKRQLDELPSHDRIAGYVSGRLGRPDIPEGAGNELKDLTRLAVKNVLSLVRDAFAQNLSVVGFRAASADEDEQVWSLWQNARLDARQAEVHRAAVTYGAAYTVVLPDQVLIRSPRQMIAVYRDPDVDLWPVYALDTWVDDSGKKPVWKGTLYDETHAYPIDLGTMPRLRGSSKDPEAQFRRRQAAQIDYDEDDAYPHRADDTPVVRFVNARDSERVTVGEIEPLIEQQRAINAVNFDRLVVSRYGAFPQRYAIGWAPSTPTELAKASMARLMAFDENKDQMAVGAFPAASVEPYNAILEEMLRHVAMTAQIPPGLITGDIENIAAEAAALIDKPHQDKLKLKRESFGESWEQHLRLQAHLAGLEVADGAEAIWRDTEARTFGAIVDGIQKLAAAGVPVESLLQDIPGWTQQRIDDVAKAVRRQRGSGVLNALRQAASGGDVG